MNRQTRIHRWSIQTLLTGLVFGLTVLCVGGAFWALAAVRAAELEEELLATSETLAQTVSEYTQSSLAFSDAEDARAALGKLRSVPSVEAATLYDSHGQVFAHYAADALDLKGPLGLNPGEPSALHAGHALIQRAVTHDGIEYGTIVLRSSVRGLTEKRRRLFTAIGGVFALIVAMSAGIAGLVHRAVTKPIQKLSNVASQVAAGASPPTRLDLSGSSEIGVLAESLEKMFSELNRRASALEETHATLQGLVEASPLAIVGTGPNGAIALWSHQAEQIFGVSASRAKGARIEQVVGDTDFGRLWARAQAGVPASPEECLWSPAPGKTQTLMVSAAALSQRLGVSGSEPATVLVVEDITERRRAQRELDEKDHQLQRIQKQEVVGRMAAGVAHDFNNLLTVVTACSALIQDEVEESANAEVCALSQAMIDAAMRGAALTKRLLTFSSPGVKEVLVVDLCQTLVDFKPLLKSVLFESIAFEVRVPAEALKVKVDTGQLEQVLLNLVINSRDALSGGGKINVTLQADGQSVFIACEDNGEGMSATTSEKIFEPFYTTKERGTGLGLATSRQIMQGFGGDVVCRSRVGVGTTMTLSLPLAAEAEAEAAGAVSERCVTGSIKVLLVEDDALIRRFVQQVLVNAGYSVVVCEDAAQAVQCVKDPFLKVDLLLTDVVMPGVSGPALAVQLREYRPNLPVLFMSGHVGDVLATHGLVLESTSLLEKPFTASELSLRILKVLEQTPEVESKIAKNTAS